MVQTYKSFKSIEDVRKVSQEQFISEYQATQDPQILARMFCSNVGLIFTTSKEFFNLSSPDVASFSVEELHRALLVFNLERKQAKFSTYFRICLHNRLRKETQALSCTKRKALDKCLSDDDLDLKVFDDLTHINFQLLPNLTDQERRFCAFLSSNTHSLDSDFAKLEKVTSARIHYLRDSLRQKLICLIS